MPSQVAVPQQSAPRRVHARKAPPQPARLLLREGRNTLCPSVSAQEQTSSDYGLVDARQVRSRLRNHMCKKSATASCQASAVGGEV